MNQESLLLIGEIVFDPALSFEACADIEEELKNALQERAAALGAPFVELSATGDGLRFQAAPPPADTADIRNFCLDLSLLFPKGVTGRVLAVRHGLGHIDCLYISPSGLTDIPVPRP